MLTSSQFVVRLGARRTAGDSLSAIGRDFGVSRQAVQQWLDGATQPSQTVLILAEQIYRVPLAIAPGLPLAAERD